MVFCLEKNRFEKYMVPFFAMCSSLIQGVQKVTPDFYFILLLQIRLQGFEEYGF